jgi:hypothetical protein
LRQPLQPLVLLVDLFPQLLDLSALLGKLAAQRLDLIAGGLCRAQAGRD